MRVRSEHEGSPGPGGQRLASDPAADQRKGARGARRLTVPWKGTPLPRPRDGTLAHAHICPQPVSSHRPLARVHASSPARGIGPGVRGPEGVSRNWLRLWGPETKDTRSQGVGKGRVFLRTRSENSKGVSQRCVPPTKVLGSFRLRAHARSRGGACLGRLEHRIGAKLLGATRAQPELSDVPRPAGSGTLDSTPGDPGVGAPGGLNPANTSQERASGPSLCPNEHRELYR